MAQRQLSEDAEKVANQLLDVLEQIDGGIVSKWEGSTLIAHISRTMLGLRLRAVNPTTESILREVADRPRPE